MPKLNVFSLPRPERKTETRLFEENGQTIELTLQAPDAADMARAAEAAKKLVEDFITGSDLRAAADFPEGIKVSEALFQSAALLSEMQVGDDPNERYTPIELVILSTRLPRTWMALQSWAAELVSAWSTNRGN